MKQISVELKYMYVWIFVCTCIHIYAVLHFNKFRVNLYKSGITTKRAHTWNESNTLKETMIFFLFVVLRRLVFIVITIIKLFNIFATKKVKWVKK